jgi:hypothetical protein
MRRPLFPLTALAPAQVWSMSYVQGLGALTTRGPSWSGDGVAMATCDEPATSGVALPPAGAAPSAGVSPPAVVATPAAGVNCDAPTSSARCGESMVGRMSLYPNSSQPRCSSVVVSKVGWNIGGVDEEGISVAGN